MYGPRESIPVRELVEFILRNGYTPVELSIVNSWRSDGLVELPINDVAYAMSVLSSLLISNATRYTTPVGSFYSTNDYESLASQYDAGFHTLPIQGQAGLRSNSGEITGVFVPLRLSEDDSYADYKVVDAFYLESRVGNEKVRILFIERPLGSQMSRFQWLAFQDMFQPTTQRLLERFEIDTEMDYLSTPQIQNIWLELSYAPLIELASFFIINYNRRRPVHEGVIL